MFLIVTAFLVGSILIGTIIGSVVIQQRRLLRTRASFAGRLLQAQDRERAAISRELHDDVVQRLDSIARLLRAARQADSIRQGEAVADVSAAVRTLSHRMHPEMVRVRGIAVALESLIYDLRSQHPMEFSLEVRGDTTNIPADVASSMFRIAQEALQNAVRHAGARAIDVRLERDVAKMLVSVRDDGVGFRDLGKRNSKGLGLQSMRERASLLHGSFEIRSTLGVGTKVTATFHPRIGA